MTPDDKKQRIDKRDPNISIARQCELAGLARSTYYGKTPVDQETPENLEIMRLIDELFTAHPFYGSRQMRNCQMPGHRLPKSNVKKCQDIDYPTLN